MSKAYLMFYNLASALGWAYVLFRLIQVLSNNNYNIDTGAQLWSEIGTTLTIVQSCAMLEIVHSLLGLVRAPLLPTFLQVYSRIAIVYSGMLPTNGAHGHWSLYLCIGSWALVEIPRYLFYLVALNTKGEPHKIPSLLFFLRYSLFIVLYPAGITGELLVLYFGYSDSLFWNAVTFLDRFVSFNMLVYIPGAPFMIMNMWRNRKKVYKKRQQAADSAKGGKKAANTGKGGKPLKGLIWPVTNDDTGERSTSKTNKAIWAQSVANVDTDQSSKVSKERNWRFGYSRHVMKNVVLSCQSKENALKVANDGLNAAYEKFEFMRDGKVISFKKAMTKGVFDGRIYETHVIRGDSFGKEKNVNAEVPYGGGKYQGKPYYLGKHDNTVISGVQLREQLNKWVEYGTIEPSAAEAINMVNLNRNEWLDLSNHYFILLGATSAMGPLFFLLKHGANVIAVDLDRDFIWNKLFKAVRNSSGSLIFPVKKEGLAKQNVSKISDLDDSELAKISGCDLLSDTPEIANWLVNDVCNNKDIMSNNAPVTIGNYTYLDGALHVQLSLACDSIIDRLCKERKGAKPMIAFLCTPTDNHICGEDAFNAAKKAFQKEVPTWASLLNSIFMGKFLGSPNYKGMKSVELDAQNKLFIIDGIAVAQGPNYALAKRLQHWRAITAHTNGHVVSSNVAPSTATMSVVHNAQFAAAYGGMHQFKPMEVMYQRTSLAVMGLLLIHDIRNKESASNSQSKIARSLRNPLELISYGSFHGGVWRCSYKINKIGVPSALAFYMSTYKFYIISGTLGVISGFNWIATGKWIPLR